MRMRPSRHMRACALLALLGGCGFQPVFAPASTDTIGGAAGRELAQVDVALVPERSGQILRQDVQERLERFGTGIAKHYKLYIAFSFVTDQAGILPDSSATFTRVHANADWRLTLMDAPSTLVTTGSARALDGFNQLDQQVFASDLETESVEQKLAARIADEITLQLAVYFRQRAGAIAPA